MKIYTTDELKKLKPGAVFEHPSLGRCIILRNRKAGYTYMAFRDGHPDAWFMKDNFPWNVPMRRIEEGNVEDG